MSADQTRPVDQRPRWRVHSPRTSVASNLLIDGWL